MRKALEILGIIILILGLFLLEIILSAPFVIVWYNEVISHYKLYIDKIDKLFI